MAREQTARSTRNRSSAHGLAGVIEGVAHPRAELVRTLRARHRLRPMSGREVVEAAETFGVCRSTVYRWLNGDGAEGRRTRARLSKDAIELIYDHRGNIAAAYREIADLPDTPSRTTFYRAVHESLLPVELAHASGGTKAALEYRAALLRPPVDRLEVVETDHKQLAIDVFWPRHRNPGHAWVTIFQDSFSRAILGYALSKYPSSADILAAAREAFTIDPDTGIGGIPDELWFDRGADFMSDAVAIACATLGIEARPLPPYSPNLKGKVERLNGSIDMMFTRDLPGFRDGPLDRKGKRPRSVGYMTVESVAAELRGWVHWYNTEHQHRGLNGRTPLEVWGNSDKAIRKIPAEELRWMLLKADRRKMQKDGLSFRAIKYTSPALSGRVGERLLVRFMPHDYRSIEVFDLRDEWICTAFPQGTLTEEQASEFKRQAREQERDANRQRRTAAKRGKIRYGSITDNIVEDVSVYKEGAPVDARRSISEDDLDIAWLSGEDR